MQPAPFNLLLETASRDNILVLTTQCTTSCVFCSHLQNPREVNAYYIEELSNDQIDTLIEFLDGKRKIVIGESATRICEGEPFLREDIISILKKIRYKYPDAPIQITTSGIHLEDDVLAELDKLGGIELYISLNSSSIQGRKKLYRGRPHWSAVDAVKKLKGYGMEYSGSIVAMPHLVGWEDIRDTVLFLDEHEASTIRIFMPGYTKFSRALLPPDDIKEELEGFASELCRQIDTPLIVEPSNIKDLYAVVEGVLRGSPASESGIQRGDRIMRINGKEAVSRVDAYLRILAAGRSELEVLREGRTMEFILKKEPKAPSGMVFRYDIHPDTIIGIERGILRNRSRSCLILTSELAYNVLSLCIEKNSEVELEAVKNRYFGGNIMCAGLLTISDIEAHMSDRPLKPEVLILPEIMFDSTGRDLLGRHFSELEEEFEIIVEVI